MVEKLDGKEVVSYEESLIMQVTPLDTFTRLVIEREIITEAEFFDKLKYLNQEYEKRRAVEV